MIYNFLFLLSIFILQRIDFLFTSLGFIILAILFYYSFISKVTMNNKIKIHYKHFIYLIFLTSFTYNIPYFINEVEPRKIAILIAPLLVWALLVFTDDVKAKYIFNERILYMILFIIGSILIYDFTMMYLSNTVVKKVFSFANPNYIAFLILVLEVLYMFSRKIKEKEGILFFIFATLLIFFTLSKTAYIIQILIWLSVLNRRSILKLGFVVFALSIGISIVFSEVFFEVYNAVLFFFDTDLMVAIEHRERLNAAAVNIFADHPIMGCGFDQFQHIAFTQYKSGLNVQTHNIFLTILAENGLIGLIFFLASNLLLFIYALRDKLFAKEKILFLLVFYLYALTHAEAQFFVFVPLLFYIIVSNPNDLKRT